MTGSVATLVESVHARTGFPKTFIEQRARYLQAAGRLRVTAGAKQPPAVPRDAINILFSLAADRARGAPHLVSDFESLERLGDCDPSERRAGDFLEWVIARLWAGNRTDARAVISLWHHPTPQLDLTDGDGHPRRFYPTGQLMEMRGSDLVRKGLDIPCKVIAAIGADIGHSGCAYAL